MQRHEVRLRGAESWDGGGWGRTASAPPCGRVRVVWRRCPVAAFPLRLRGRLGPGATGEPLEQTFQAGHPLPKIVNVAPHIVHFHSDIAYFEAHRAQPCQHQSAQCGRLPQSRQSIQRSSCFTPNNHRHDPTLDWIAGSTYQNPNRSIGRVESGVRHCPLPM